MEVELKNKNFIGVSLLEKLVIEKIINVSFINNVDEKSIYVDVYVVAKNIETGRKKPIKIRMINSQFLFFNVDKEEWNNNKKTALSTEIIRDVDLNDLMQTTQMT